MSQRARTKAVGAFRVGDQVGVRLAGRVLPAVILEDRGNLGPGGTRLVRVELKANDIDASGNQFEVPADALVARTARTR